MVRLKSVTITNQKDNSLILETNQIDTNFLAFIRSGYNDDFWEICLEVFSTLSELKFVPEITEDTVISCGLDENLDLGVAINFSTSTGDHSINLCSVHGGLSVKSDNLAALKEFGHSIEIIGFHDNLPYYDYLEFRKPILQKDNLRVVFANNPYWIPTTDHVNVMTDAREDYWITNLATFHENPESISNENAFEEFCHEKMLNLPNGD